MCRSAHDDREAEQRQIAARPELDSQFPDVGAAGSLAIAIRPFEPRLPTLQCTDAGVVDARDLEIGRVHGFPQTKKRQAGGQPVQARVDERLDGGHLRDVAKRPEHGRRRKCRHERRDLPCDLLIVGCDETAAAGAQVFSPPQAED